MRMLPIGSGIGACGSQEVMLFGKVVEALGGGAYYKKYISGGGL